MKTMQKRIVIVAIFVLSMLFVLLGAFILNKQASAESAIQTDNAGLYDSFTNTDVHDGENIAYFKSIYGQEIVFHDGAELGDGYDSNYTYMEIKDDSSILKIVIDNEDLRISSKPLHPEEKQSKDSAAV